MRVFLALAATALLTTSCSLVGGDDDSGVDASKRVVLVTHESFVMSEELQKQFERESGYHLVVRGSGDAGALTNKLVLTKDNPTGDVTFGIDNTFGSRAIDEGVLAPYAAKLPEGADQYLLAGDDAGDGAHALTPIDTGNVCVNIDNTWFADHQIPAPTTLDDLVKVPYRDLFVTPGATTSSPGLAFLLTTIAAYGDVVGGGWEDYWARLMKNGTKLTPGWSDAYEVDFTQGGGGGDRPIVLSYDSSPAFTTDGNGGTTTSALLDTCFQQVEYAGVLAGAANTKGAQALVDFMLTRTFQEALPDAMYVFPVDAGAALPPDWAKFAPRPEHPFAVDPAAIAEHRDEWLRAWSDVTSMMSSRRLFTFIGLSLVPVLVLAVFFVLPVLGMVSQGFFVDGRFDPAGVAEVLARPRTHRVLWFTVWSAGLATVFSLLLGLPAAYVLHRLAFPFRGLIRALLLVPFVLPTVVVGVGFRLLVGESGPLGFLGLDGTPVAIIAGLVFFNVAVVIRAVGATWESLDARPAEAAAALGASPAQVFRTVTLPALRPAIVSAASVVFLFCATSFGVVLTLGGLRYSSVETEIYLLTTTLFDLQAAAALSILQLLAVAALLVVAGRLRATADPTVERRPGRPRRPRRQDLPQLAVTVLVLVLVAAPVLTLVVGSLRRGDTWSLDNYRGLTTTGEGTALVVPVTDALVTSLRTAVDATWMSLLLGVLIAVVVSRRSLTRGERRLRSGLDGFFMLPLGVSAVTLGFGILITLDRPPLDLRDSRLLVPIAQALVALPLVVRTLAPVFTGVDDRQRQAAASLGAGPLRTFVTVDLPAVRRPLLAAAGFAFAVSLGEFGATSFLARDEHPTLPVVIYQLIGRPGSDNFGMALAASVVLASATALVVLAVDRLGVRSVGAL